MFLHIEFYGVGVKRITIDRNKLNCEIKELLTKRKDIYPTPNRIARAFRRKQVMISEVVIRDAIGSGELEELQEKRIKKWKPEKLLFEFRSLTFARVTERIDIVLTERLGKIITGAIRKDDGSWNCIDELGFSSGTWKKFLKKIPEMEKVLEEKGMNEQEFMKMIYKKVNERKKMGEN